MDNIYIFGMRADTAVALEREGGYNPMNVFEQNAEIRRALMQMIDGTLMPESPTALQALYHDLMFDDRYFVMKDFPSYYEAKLQAIRDAKTDEAAFARKCLVNIACAGKFSSDRTIRQYAKEIWNV
jgi:starch phosphorylase